MLELGAGTLKHGDLATGLVPRLHPGSVYRKTGDRGSIATTGGAQGPVEHGDDITVLVVRFRGRAEL